MENWKGKKAKEEEKERKRRSKKEKCAKVCHQEDELTEEEK